MWSVSSTSVFRAVLSLGFVVLSQATGSPAMGQGSAVDEEGRVVQFQRDIAPIFRDRCLKCHNERDLKGDFRIDDPDSVFSYVEPNELESSTLYVDYLITDDPDYLMPPHTHGGPLSAGELSLIRVWIEEGAAWPEGASVAAMDADEVADRAETIEPPKSLAERVWSFQGYFHPATVHFPIALLLFGAFFVVLGWVWKSLGDQIPLACLLLGAPSAVVASAMGFAFADTEGYGSWAKFDMESEVFWHRWSGVIVAATSLFFALIALRWLRCRKPSLGRVWKFGLLVSAGMVGAVGHQGGELHYGEEFYQDAFAVLLPDSDSQEEAPAINAADAGGGESAEAEGTDTEEGDSSDSQSETNGGESTEINRLKWIRVRRDHRMPDQKNLHRTSDV